MYFNKIQIELNCVNLYKAKYKFTEGHERRPEKKIKMFLNKKQYKGTNYPKLNL